MLELTPEFADPGIPFQTDSATADSAVSTESASDLQMAAQGLIDYAQNITNTGDELMFTMDVPYVPAQDTSIVLAQIATASAGAAQPDYLLKLCQETESTGDPKSAMRSVDPAGWLALELGGRSNRDILNNPTALGSIKISLLEGTTHGKITTEIDNTGRTSYGYDPEPSYVGNDRAVFMAEFEGKRYKIVVELHVFVMVDEKLPSSCPTPQLIKVNGKSVPGLSDYDLNAISVAFADLPGAAIGQTTDSTITLDTNAAGYQSTKVFRGQF